MFVDGIATANDAAVMKALEDAVADGMDVANLSLDFGVWCSPINFQDFPEGAAQERASAMGLIIINAAGNYGPERSTMTALTPSVLSVAASGNYRVFGGPVKLDDGTSYLSIPLGAALPRWPQRDSPMRMARMFFASSKLTQTWRLRSASRRSSDGGSKSHRIVFEPGARRQRSDQAGRDCRWPVPLSRIPQRKLYR